MREGKEQPWEQSDKFKGSEERSPRPEHDAQWEEKETADHGGGHVQLGHGDRLILRTTYGVAKVRATVTGEENVDLGHQASTPGARLQTPTVWGSRLRGHRTTGMEGDIGDGAWMSFKGKRKQGWGKL